MAAAAHTVDRAISVMLIFIWGSLIVFGAITAGSPQWLAGASVHGRRAEAENYRDIGDARLITGDLDGAVAAYLQGLTLLPDLPGARVQLGIAYARLGRFSQAAATFEAALQAGTAFPEVAHYNLGEAYEQMGDLDRAVEHVRRAAEGSPVAFKPYIKLAQLHVRLEQWPEVLAAYQAALEHRRTLAVAYRSAMRSTLRQAEEPETRAAVERLLAAEELAALPSRFDAEIFERLLSRDREIAVLHNHIGQAHMMMGQRAEGVAAFRRALAIWPGYPAALRNLESATAG